jgi:hypothetical protein
VRKILVIALVIPSASVRLSAKSERTDAVSVEKLLAGSQKVRFVKTNRNPFLPHRQATVSTSPRQSGIKKKQEGPVSPPKVVINGIMGEQASPLVMLTLPDGSSAAIKVGQTVGDIMLKKVEKDRVLIVFQKKNFWINR